MPPRTPLALRSSNITSRKELSPYIRGQIIGLAKVGETPTQISKQLNLPNSIVRSTLQKAPQRKNGISASRSGTPKAYSRYERMKIIRFARIHLKATYAQLKSETRVKISIDTIRRILKEVGITNWRVKQRPELTEALVTKRLAWCKVRENWTREQWSNYMWSDECSIERGKGKSREWCFRTPE